MNKHKKIEALTRELLSGVADVFAKHLDSKAIFNKDEVNDLVGAGGSLASVVEHVESFMNSLEELENYVNRKNAETSEESIDV
jgi:hypothetical protein